MLLFPESCPVWSEIEQLTQTRSHHLPVDNVDSNPSKFQFLVTSHLTYYMSSFWQRSLRPQGPEDMLLPLQALALLPEEDLRLCICRTCWNACVRKGEHGVQALGGNCPLRKKGKKISECSSCFVLSNLGILESMMEPSCRKSVGDLLSLVDSLFHREECFVVYSQDLMDHETDCVFRLPR